MTFDAAINNLMNYQGRNLKKVNGIIIDHKGYQYRFRYLNSLVDYIGIDRRKIGERNYKYFSGIYPWRCCSVADAVSACMDEIEKKLS